MKVWISHFERRLSRATMTDVAGALAGTLSDAAQLTTSLTVAAKSMTISGISFSSVTHVISSSMTALGSQSSSLKGSFTNWSKLQASLDASCTDESSEATSQTTV